MADGVSPLMKQVEAAACEPVLKRVPTEAEIEQLPPRYHPMLPLR